MGDARGYCDGGHVVLDCFRETLCGARTAVRNIAGAEENDRV